MRLRLLSALSGLLIAFAALAQGAPVEGTDYVELRPPQAVDTQGKVEVIEFFWYRCPHCYALEPELEAWIKRLPRDVQFKRVPGILNDDWAVDARIFYALEAIGEVERVHRGLFNAIHQQGGVRLRGDAFAKWVADWLAKQKVDMRKYDAALHSFSVESKLRRAAQMASAYRLDGVPALIVQGRYVVLAATSQKAMLATTDFLIGEARKQLSKAKP
ncbi:MAG TPA: thiol:disulfide interchange protein DsbA/DsbL [Burkholderiales bacterium]|nr:thiol:disulfide interchange protein DsbA/DsbL [Burkholderiales bacterium]